jgi:hypothetical protein
MEQVWSAGRPLLVREIQQALQPERAYNTVWTVTEILHRKGWLAREKEGRAYRYRATVSRGGEPARLCRAAAGRRAGAGTGGLAVAALSTFPLVLLAAPACCVFGAGY